LDSVTSIPFFDTSTYSCHPQYSRSNVAVLSILTL
jgi:hypothetical protein